MKLWFAGEARQLGLSRAAARQYASIDYTQTLIDHGVVATVGSVGDAYDNALAESFVTP